jgi:hypothetical protein
VDAQLSISAEQRCSDRDRGRQKARHQGDDDDAFNLFLQKQKIVKLVANLQETISAGGRDFQTPDGEPGEQSLALEESTDDSCPSLVGKRFVARDFVHQVTPVCTVGDLARGRAVEGAEALRRRTALH